ncbi:PD-(D/E)XK nuclease family protein [Nostoc sp. FACHB-190]|uniref:PD-(D/E)XK nuclease family protein n=1 Tax=Nostoc sp. FACHB-190 TaxID=2692838 RepID=UPI001687854C|nr:PD-(D/E)XK nuclease family protein [Nostoc sp. FACHB-190]MBD2302222.1 PD-(D/E)XK nuclease family protein [Nostoc sp. FACHB-190]
MTNNATALNKVDVLSVGHSQQVNQPAEVSSSQVLLPQQLTATSLGLASRKQTYIHPSWLAKALSGDRQCMFSLHTQGNYFIPKADNDFDAQGYKLKHQAVLNQYAKELKAEGYTVYTEASNSFWYETKAGALISAQPDMVAVRGDEVIVPDIKTGKELKASDIAQVKLYMALIPAVRLHGICQIPTGQLVHQGQVSEIPATEITTDFKRQVAELVNTMTSATTPLVTPSVHECRWCPLHHLCPAKVENVAKGQADWL